MKNVNIFTKILNWISFKLYIKFGDWIEVDKYEFFKFMKKYNCCSKRYNNCTYYYCFKYEQNVCGIHYKGNEKFIMKLSLWQGIYYIRKSVEVN